MTEATQSEDVLPDGDNDWGRGMEIGTIKGPEGSTIFVELMPTARLLPSEIEDLPEGAEPTGVAEQLESSVTRVKTTIAAAVALGTEAFKQYSPTEWKIEFQIGFTGKVNPVPILVGAEAKAVLKISATWKKD